jgi:hypothetical protein
VSYHREIAKNLSDAVLDLFWDPAKSWFYVSHQVVMPRLSLSLRFPKPIPFSPLACGGSIFLGFAECSHRVGLQHHRQRPVGHLPPRRHLPLVAEHHPARTHRQRDSRAQGGLGREVSSGQVHRCTLGRIAASHWPAMGESESECEYGYDSC